LKGIADTGFIVAFANRNDQYHSWAAALARRVSEPLLTCEAVLSEAAFQLSSASIIFKLMSDQLVTLSFNLRENVHQVQELAERYRDRQPDLADLCLVRMSELYPKHSIVTVDADFRFYRRNKRESIPLISPRTT
jgi:uncharacterized protein